MTPKFTINGHAVEITEIDVQQIDDDLYQAAVTLAVNGQITCTLMFQDDENEGGARDETFALGNEHELSCRPLYLQLLTALGADEDPDADRIADQLNELPGFDIMACYINEQIKAAQAADTPAHSIEYLLYQGDYCAQGAAEPFTTLDEALHAMNDLQKNLGWTGLEIRRQETINDAVHSRAVAWGLDAGDLCVTAHISDTGSISVSGATEPESWQEVIASADNVQRVQALTGHDGFTGHYQVWVNGNPEPLNYLVSEADEADETEE